MLAKCAPNLCAMILGNVKNLKGMKSHCGDFFFINEQLPDKLSEECSEAYEGLRMWKAQNDTLPKKQKVKVKVQKNRLYINNDLVKKQVVPPALDEQFEAVPDIKEHKSPQAIALSRSDTQSEKGCHFFAAACSIQDVDAVCKAYKKMKLFYPSVDHVITTYSTQSY